MAEGIRAPGSSTLGSSLKIYREALLTNIGKVRKAIGQRFLWAVIKANGYGIGAELLAPLMEGGVDGFAVARVEEALELRRAGIRLPILCLGPLEEPLPQDENLHITLSSLYDLDRAIALGMKNPVHFKYETGMGRLGFTTEPELLVPRLRRLKAQVVGLWSHLTRADDPLHPASTRQRERLFNLYQKFQSLGVEFPQVHIANSAGLLHLEPWETAVRVGLFLYGVSPWQEPQPALIPEPSLEWVSLLRCVRKLPGGSPLSYQETYTLSQDAWVGVVPVGYADGLTATPPRTLEVFAAGRRYPVRGRITMDLMIVEIGREPLPEGTPVYLLGPRDHPLGITVRELARNLGIIPYELLTRIGRRVERCLL